GRAPDVLRAHPSAKMLHLPTSYRLGSRSVEAIGPLYDFPFDSGRPERIVTGHEEIESVQIDRDVSVVLFADVAQLSQCFICQDLTTNVGSRALTPNDVAVVAGYNQAVNGIAGFLSNLDVHPGVTVGTAVRLQGRQLHDVIAVDPL